MPEQESVPQIKLPQSHTEAVELFESHRELFEHYARGAIKIEPAPASLETFAFDLEKNTIYMNSMFYKNLGFSDERTVFATMHEIEHLLEKKQILNENGGALKFKKYLDKIKKSRSFSLTDNCVADIHVNRTVVSKTNETVGELEKGVYREVLFKETDFTKSPKHIQLPQALLREARVPDEKCTVDSQVRTYLDQIQDMTGRESGRKFIDVLTDPNTSMSERLDLQDRIIMPIIDKLKQQDIEEEKEKRKQKGDGKNGDKGEKGGENKEGNGQGENSEENEGEGGEQSPDSDPQDVNGKPKKGKKVKSDSSGKKSGNENAGADEDFDKNFDPNKFWKEQYDAADKNTPNAVPVEKIEEEVKKFEENMKDAKKREKQAQENADQEYADSLGVTKQELQNYREYLKQIEKIVNPETGVSAIEEIRDLIARIISKRKKNKLNPRYPTEEGELLVDPATLMAEVRAGNLQPKVWETTDLKERPSNKFGEVEITLVADLSGSMKGEKAREQLKSAVLMMEALKEFGDICREEKNTLNKPLEIRSEVYSFQATDADKTPIKNMSAELSETDRIRTASKLTKATGQKTTDFVTLEAINSEINDESKEKMKRGELKKIVIVFTDGDSDSPSAVKNKLELLRKLGVVVIGVGITADGKSALTTYAPDAKLAEQASALPIVLKDLLKEHLSDL